MAGIIQNADEDHDMLRSRLSKIQYIVVDVDGTMTDAGIYYDDHGNELKKFCTKDAAGYFAAHQVGMKVVVLTGRECYAVTRRMKEMKADYILQNVKDKAPVLRAFMKEHGITRESTAYIGDDLNDYEAMKLTCFCGCPADSCREIMSIADYVSPVRGGRGAVRDIIEYMLKIRGEWNEAVKAVYGITIDV